MRLRPEQLAALGVPARSRPRARPRPVAAANGAPAARPGGQGDPGGARAHLAQGARRAGGTGTRAHRAHRGGPPPPRRGALRLAGPPCQRPHHRHRSRRHDQLPEPVDRALARVRCRGMVGRRFDELLDPSDRDRVRGAARRRGRRRSRAAGGPAVHAGARERHAAPVRGQLHQPAGGRARGRHRAQLPRHQRAQGVRGTAHPPGIPRPGHRAREPRAVRRASATRDRAKPAGSITASPSCSSTSTTSRRSTTASVMPPATRCSSRSAKRLATSIRASDTAARFGGDEFALLLEDIDGRAGGGRHG